VRAERERTGSRRLQPNFAITTFSLLDGSARDGAGAIVVACSFAHENALL
jgi:hypothetical protein